VDRLLKLDPFLQETGEPETLKLDIFVVPVEKTLPVQTNGDEPI
jgi:hypothetical protein